MTSPFSSNSPVGTNPSRRVEPGGPAVLRYIAGQQLRRALGPHQLRDLADDRRAVAAALVPLVDEELPQEPWPDDFLAAAARSSS